MATTSFDKRMEINQKEAEFLAKKIDEHTAQPGIDKSFWANNEKDVKEWLSRFEK